MMPLDTLKTRMQFQGNLTTVRRYSSYFDALRSIFAEEGIRGFFRGLSPKLLYKGPAGAVSFGCYELLKRLIHRPAELREHYKEKSLDNPLVPIVAGTAARIVGTASRTPFDIVKQRLQIQGSLKSPKYEGSVNVSKKLWKNEGFKGLWTGLSVSLLRDLPFGAIYFVSYELLKQSLGRQQVSLLRLDSSVNHFLAGAGSGFLATTLTIPFDVVKTRLQTQASHTERKYTGVGNAFQTIMREEGVRGLTTGLVARLLYLIPATSITFVSYEKYKVLLGVK